MRRAIFAIALAFIFALGVTGCGKKGALDEPGKADEDERPHWYKPQF